MSVGCTGHFAACLESVGFVRRSQDDPIFLFIKSGLFREGIDDALEGAFHQKEFLLSVLDVDDDFVYAVLLYDSRRLQDPR